MTMMAETTEEVIDQPSDSMRLMQIIDETGDTKLRWDSSNATEVENAQRTFEEMTRRGFLAYKTKGGEQTLVRDFDPEAEKMLLTPPVVAG